MTVLSASLFLGLSSSASAVDATAHLADAVLVEVKADERPCAPPFCGSYWFREVGAETTVCHDGVEAPACYAATIEFGLAGLLVEQEYEPIIEMALDGVLYLEVIVDTVYVAGPGLQLHDFGRLRVVGVQLSQGPVNR